MPTRGTDLLYVVRALLFCSRAYADYRQFRCSTDECKALLQCDQCDCYHNIAKRNYGGVNVKATPKNVKATS